MGHLDTLRAATTPGRCVGRDVRISGVDPDTVATVGIGLATIGAALGAYHGYKRDNSVGWALWWAAWGALVPIVTVPVAIAQGFGKPKGTP